jgi:hypothetical protein
VLVVGAVVKEVFGRCLTLNGPLDRRTYGLEGGPVGGFAVRLVLMGSLAMWRFASSRLSARRNDLRQLAHICCRGISA